MRTFPPTSTTTTPPPAAALETPAGAPDSTPGPSPCACFPPYGAAALITSGARTGRVRPAQKCCTANAAATTSSTVSAATLLRSRPHRDWSHNGSRSRTASPARSRHAPASPAGSCEAGALAVPGTGPPSGALLAVHALTVRALAVGVLAVGVLRGTVLSAVEPSARRVQPGSGTVSRPWASGRGFQGFRTGSVITPVATAVFALGTSPASRSVHGGPFPDSRRPWACPVKSASARSRRAAAEAS